MEAQLSSLPNLFADPVRLSGDPPYYSSELARRAEPFWHECSTASRASRIPNEVHQPWLHGTTPKWEHVLGMLSAKFIVQPAKYTLYYDKWPQRVSPQWDCFCAIASCVRRQPSTGVPLRRGRRVKMGHWPELMRYDVLIEHGVSLATSSLQASLLTLRSHGCHGRRAVMCVLTRSPFVSTFLLRAGNLP